MLSHLRVGKVVHDTARCANDDVRPLAQRNCLRRRSRHSRSGAAQVPPGIPSVTPDTSGMQPAADLWQPMCRRQQAPRAGAVAASLHDAAWLFLLDSRACSR